MTDLSQIPDDATSVSICPCGAAAWTTGDSNSADDQQWFDDFNAAHADCETETAEHYEVARPEFGYVADSRDFFSRSAKAQDFARQVRESGALYLADACLRREIDDFDRNSYRRDIAAAAYARAVYEVEAAKVRAA